MAAEFDVEDSDRRDPRHQVVGERLSEAGHCVGGGEVSLRFELREPGPGALHGFRGRRDFFGFGLRVSLAGDIRGHAFINWTDYGHRFNATRQAVIRYRLALIGYAAEKGLKLPPWVRTIGGK